MGAVRPNPEQIQARGGNVVERCEAVQELLARPAQRRTLLRLARGVELLHPGRQLVGGRDPDLEEPAALVVLVTEREPRRSSIGHHDGAI